MSSISFYCIDTEDKRKEIAKIIRKSGRDSAIVQSYDGVVILSLTKSGNSVYERDIIQGKSLDEVQDTLRKDIAEKSTPHLAEVILKRDGDVIFFNDAELSLDDFVAKVDQPHDF